MYYFFISPYIVKHIKVMHIPQKLPKYHQTKLTLYLLGAQYRQLPRRYKFKETMKKFFVFD